MDVGAGQVRVGEGEKGILMAVVVPISYASFQALTHTLEPTQIYTRQKAGTEPSRPIGYYGAVEKVH